MWYEAISGTFVFIHILLFGTYSLSYYLSSVIVPKPLYLSAIIVLVT